jgi:V8-like Glu-specific endopeptidase
MHQGASRAALGAVLAAALLMPASRGQDSAPPSRPFGGTAAVGALFTVNADGRLGQHFCSASVVHSRNGDLVLTAAHCLDGRTIGGARGIVFVPGYHRGRAPHGIWKITEAFVDQAWQANRDPDHDYAFLVARRPGTALEQITGAETLGIGLPPQRVTVIGYPDSTQQPVTCTGRARVFQRTQWVFRCSGYPDGTSGGPFLAQVDPATGRGTVMGVIGGYQQGGATADVSYSARLASPARTLYRQAVAAS